jgi:hypothetical protein
MKIPWMKDTLGVFLKLLVRNIVLQYLVTDVERWIYDLSKLSFDTLNYRCSLF